MVVDLATLRSGPDTCGPCGPKTAAAREAVGVTPAEKGGEEGMARMLVAEGGESLKDVGGMGTGGVELQVSRSRNGVGDPTPTNEERGVDRV